MIKVEFNGQEQSWDGDPGLPLLWVLRDEAGLTGTKFGCGMALCGACTVHLDGEAVRSCITPLRVAGQRGHHDRGPAAGRHPSGAERLARAQRAAVRLLPGRPDHAGRGAAEQNPKPSRREITTRWPATSAAAAATSASARGPSRSRRERDMNIIDNPAKLRGLERTSSRTSAAAASSRARLAGGFVLAAPVDAAPALAYETGAGGMPHGCDRPARLRRRSRPTARSPSSRIAPRWAPASRTSMPMVVADELEADWARVKVAQAPGDEPSYGNQDTDGSRSTRHFICSRCASCGAAARRCWSRPRPKRWGVPATEVQGEEPRGRAQRERPQARLSARSPPTRPKLPVPRAKASSSRTPRTSAIIGKGQMKHRRPPRHHHRQGALRRRHALPGMLYAVVARPPVLGGKVVSFDPDAALKVPGVVKVDPGAAAAVAAEIQAARRRRGDRAQHLARRSRAATR